MKYLTFLPIVVLILLFALSHRRRDDAAEASPAGAAALVSPACGSLRKELGAVRAKLATDSTNLRVKGRAAALAALTRDVCGVKG